MPGMPAPSFTRDMGAEETAKGICDSLLRVPELVEHYDNTGGGIGDGFRDLLIAFRGISETLEENADDKRESLNATGQELSTALELLNEAYSQSEAAYRLVAAVDKGEVSVLDPLKRVHESPTATAAGLAAASAYRFTIYMAYRVATLARQAAASGMDATISEVQAALASRVASDSTKETAKGLASDAKAAADTAKEAAKEARALAAQAAAESMDLWMKLRDSNSEGMVVRIDRRSEELEAIEAIAAIIEATRGTVKGMLPQAEERAADAEAGARNASLAVAVVWEAASECPPKQTLAQEFLDELTNLININDFLNRSLGGPTVRRKLPEETLTSLSEMESFQLRKLAEFSRENSGKSPEELLEGSLEIMHEMGQYRKDLVRQEILKLDDFLNLEELNTFLESEDYESGIFNADLWLRRESLKKREIAFGKSGEGSLFASPAETKAASGENNSALDFSPEINCIFNNKYIRVLVDTSATSNIVSEEWVKDNNLSLDTERTVSLLLADGSIRDNCPILIGSLLVRVKHGRPSGYWHDVEFVVLKGFKANASLGLPFLKLAQITHNSTGQLLFAELEWILREEGAPRPIYNPTIEETSRDICDSLLDFPGLIDSESGETGDLLSAFRKISGTLKENANRRKERLKAVEVGLSAAEELLEAAHELLEAVGKATEAVLDLLKNEYEEESTREASRLAGWAYHAICMAYPTASSASKAAASAMEATVSEVRATTASRLAPAASKRAAEASAADANAAAGMAKEAAKEASALAIQAAAGSLGLLKSFRDSALQAGMGITVEEAVALVVPRFRPRGMPQTSAHLAPQGKVEEIERGIQELEAIEVIIEATTGALDEMVSQTEGKAAGAEEAARNAAGAASRAAEAAAEAEAAGASPPEEETTQEILEELDSLVHTNDFLNQSLGGIPVHQKLPEGTRKSLSELDSLQQHKLAEFSRENSDKSPEELLEGTLKIMRKIGQTRKDLVREQILKLTEFQKLDELNEFLDPEDSERGFLRNDLELRRKNLEKREAVFEKSGKCLFCASPSETIIASGETDSTTDLTLKLNCIFENKYMRALVDTGATCNVVSEDWIKRNNLPQDSKRTESLLSANGSVTNDCPCLTGLWMFQDKGAPRTMRRDAEFVMLKGHREDALLGMPFLKLTQIIHNSTGQILFAEYEEIPRKEGAPRPIYPNDTTEPN